MNRYLLVIALHSVIVSTLYAPIIPIDNDAAYTKLRTTHKNPIVLRFSAEWCSVCQATKEPYRMLSECKDCTYVTFAQSNVDQYGTLAAQFNVKGLPTFVFLENGQEVHRIIGLDDINTFKDTFLADIKKYFSPNASLATSLDVMSTSTDLVSTSTAQETTSAASLVDRFINFLKYLYHQIGALFYALVESVKSLF